MYADLIWRGRVHRLGIEMPAALEQRQDSDGECFVLPVLALEPVLVERAGKEGISKMQCLFGNVFERPPANDDDVVFRHVPERFMKMNSVL